MIKRIYKKIVPEKRRLKNRILLHKLTSIFYRGNHFECNCCGKSFKKFKPKGNSYLRPNAICPFCDSLERERLLLFYLQQETDIFTARKSLLHFAPEEQMKKIFKRTPNLLYTNVDLNPSFADEQADITDLQYQDESFDYIICAHVLGHVPDESKAIRELFRVLKDDGMAFILTLIDWNNPHTFESENIQTSEERLQHYTESDLARLHGADFATRIEKEGFHVDTIDYRTHFDEKACKRYSLGDGNREIIFRCTKRELNS